MILVLNYLVIAVFLYLFIGTIYMAILVMEIGGIQWWAEARDAVIQDLEYELSGISLGALKVAKIVSISLLWVMMLLTWGKTLFPSKTGKFLK